MINLGQSFPSRSKIEVEIWIPASSAGLLLNDSSDDRQPLQLLRRLFVFGTVITGHTLALWIATHAPVQAPSETVIKAPSLVAYIIQESRAVDSASLPDVTLESVTIEVQAPNIMRFDEHAALAYNSGPPFSAPHVDPNATVDITPYVAKAGLQPGHTATVVLAVDVLPDGSVGEIAVETSGGSAIVDAAAIDYTRASRWIPGTSQGRFVRTRIRYRVTFTAAG